MAKRQKQPQAAKFIAKPKKAIVIRDNGQLLELHAKKMDGIEVYTLSDEKSQEFTKRLREMVPAPQKVRRWWPFSG